MPHNIKKVIVVGLDGVEPKIVRPMLAAGELPHLAGIRQQGGFSTVASTFPAQTPVAWSTFATGTNPGGHGIYDFIRRDPKTYLPDLALNRYEQKNMFVPPHAVNLRRGTPVWQLLSQRDIPSVILRCPCTYPPDNLRGRMLAGMGVPDLRGGLGTSTFYSSRRDVVAQESENIVSLTRDGSDRITTHLIGPRSPKKKSDVTLEISLEIDRTAKKVSIHSPGQPAVLEVREGQWSDWLKVSFKAAFLVSVRGMVRFYLVRLEPELELYASPINFDPASPLFPISSPGEYARELEEQLGTFYTTGMVEDHTGLNNNRIDEIAYLQQCELVMRERERMMQYELERFEEGLFFCLFDTPDRVQHMFWRFREPEHPANRGAANGDMTRVIEEHYRRCDDVIGQVLQYVDDTTLLIVASDHGFGSFQRGFHINSWLHDCGFLKLKDGLRPGSEAGDMLRTVDWSQTKAYALGLGSIYLNLDGREENGIVAASDADQLQAEIQEKLTGLPDPDRDCQAIKTVMCREQIYHGPFADESPDLVVCFRDGYRASWDTALGGIPAGHFEDNVKKWGGDHIVDPSAVPGILFMNRTFDGDTAHLVDLAPTILASLGQKKGEAMEGQNILR